jgi:hypothetical protein
MSRGFRFWRLATTWRPAVFRRPAVVLGAAALLVLAGCRVDFVALAGGGESPARLMTSFQLAESESRWITVSGYLDPGADTDGAPRSIANDTLRVGGYTLTPQMTAGDGRREYWGTWTDPQALDLAELVHRAPRVHGIAYEPEAVSFGVHRRVGPDTVTMSAGDTVALVTDPGAEPSRPPDLAHWQLELNSHTGFRISRVGTGDIPATFQVPADWLVWAAGEPVVAWLSVRRQWEGEAAGAAYWWRLQVASDIQWILVWE